MMCIAEVASSIFEDTERHNPECSLIQAEAYLLQYDIYRVQSPKSVGEDLCKATKEWKGMRVTCKLLVQNRKVTVEIVPSATALVIKALKEPPRDRKKVKNISHDGNISWDDIYSVARAMRCRSNAKTLKGTILEILGTCRGLGCTIDGEDAEDCTEAVQDGEHEVPEK